MSGNYCIDANVFLTTWYISYPPHILGPLWDSITESKDSIEIIKPVFDEIEPISAQDIKQSIDKKKGKYPLRMWLESVGFPIPVIDDDVNHLSLLLEREYEVSPLTKGANQIDITLIAYAKVYNNIVVTLEAPQPNKPGKKSNYKIPLICKEKDVKCVDFIKMLNELDISINK